MNEKRPVTQTGEFWMVITALGYAASNIFDKIGMSTYGTDGFLGALIKCTPQFVVPLILILLAVDKKQLGERPKVPLKTYRYFVYCGFISSFIGQFFFLKAMQVGGVNVAVPTVQIWTLIGAVLGIVFLKEKFHKNIIFGAAIAVAGLVVLSIGQYLGIPVSDQWYLGIIYALITACSWAFSTLFYNKGQKLGGGRSWGMFTQYFSGAIFLLIFMGLTGRYSAFSATPGAIYATFLGSALLSTIATFGLYTAVRFSPMSKILPINTSYPALCAIVAWLFLGESMNILIGGGIILVIIGVTLSQKTKALMSEADRKTA